MATKRPADAPADGGKRTRSTRTRGIEGSYEVKLDDGSSYVILEKLFTSTRYKRYFNKKYQRTVAALVKKEKLEVFIVTQAHVESGHFDPKPKYSGKQDYRLVKEDTAIDQIIATAEAASLPRAPKIITDTKLKFFVNSETGDSYTVEMRGERTKEGIYFKAIDVGVVFEVKSFIKSVLDTRWSYKQGIHCVWFAVTQSPNPETATLDPHSPSQHSETIESSQSSTSDTPLEGQPFKELFLTFSGLLHVIHVSRSSAVANKFREWVETIVFSFAYGTKEQKKDVLTALSKTDKVTWKIMSKITQQIMCVYLLETAKRDGNANVYKFGKTENFRERFVDHMRDYGDGIQLEHLVLVPADKLYEAEETLKKSLMEHSKFRLNNKLEEISLDQAELSVVRTIIQTISDRFLGQSLIISTRHELLMLNKEREVAVLTEKLACVEKLLSSVEEMHMEKLASIEKMYAEKLSSIEEMHAEKLKSAREKLKSAQEKLATVEKMYEEKLVSIEEISQLRLQVLNADKRALQIEVDYLRNVNINLRSRHQQNAI